MLLSDAYARKVHVKVPTWTAMIILLIWVYECLCIYGLRLMRCDPYYLVRVVQEPDFLGL